MMRLSYADAEFLVRKSGKRRLGNNTFVERLDKDTIGIKLHKTTVVKIHRDGTYTLAAGGWRTTTTKDRLNRFSPIKVWQRAFEWYVGHDGVPFFDGIKVDSTGRILNAA